MSTNAYAVHDECVRPHIEHKQSPELCFPAVWGEELNMFKLPFISHLLQELIGSKTFL